MHTDHTSLINAFKRFAEAILERDLTSESMFDISKALNMKTNELVIKAVYTANVDITRLKRELYELEQTYLARVIRKYEKPF